MNEAGYYELVTVVSLAGIFYLFIILYLFIYWESPSVLHRFFVWRTCES